MGKVLDLRQYQEETLDITMLDGSVVRVKKPTQKLVIKIMAFQGLAEDTAQDKVLAALDDSVLAILSNNADGAKVPKAMVAGLEVVHKLAILRAYTDFIQGVQSDPN